MTTKQRKRTTADAARVGALESLHRHRKELNRQLDELKIHAKATKGKIDLVDASQARILDDGTLPMWDEDTGELLEYVDGDQGNGQFVIRGGGAPISKLPSMSTRTPSLEGLEGNLAALIRRLQDEPMMRGEQLEQISLNTAKDIGKALGLAIKNDAGEMKTAIGVHLALADVSAGAGPGESDPELIRRITDSVKATGLDSLLFGELLQMGVRLGAFKTRRAVKAQWVVRISELVNRIRRKLYLDPIDPFVDEEPVQVQPDRWPAPEGKKRPRRRAAV